jgi:tetratricopeptide (TPR) repeat protein
MIRFSNALVLVFTVTFAVSGQNQAGTKPAAGSESEKATAYYNFSMGHLYAELAGAFGNRGDYLNKAIEHYKAALKADPGATFMFEELTDLYIQAGRLKDAVTEAEEMLRQNPDNLDSRRILGRIYTRLIGDTQQGRVNEEMLRRATEQYQKITQADPKDVEGWLTLGRLYRISSNSVESEKAYKKALELDADSEEALTGLAAIYSDLGDTKKSIDMLQRVTSRAPNLRTMTALASAYEQTRDYPNAVDALKKALELDPQNSRLRRALAQDLMLADKLDESLALYTQLAKEEPRDAQLQVRMSEIYRQRREFNQARAALDRAKELDRDSLEVRFNEVNLLDAEGKTDQAITTMKGILDETAKKSYTAGEKGNRAMLLERLAGLYRSGNQPRQAVEVFRQIAELDPDTGPRVAVQVIDTYRMAKDFPKAQEEADAALKKYPQDRLVQMVHASVLADVGKTDQAIAELKALAKDEKDREIQLALAQIYEKAKRFDDMEKALAVAERLSQSKQDKESVYFMRGAMFERMKKFDSAEAEFRKVLDANPQNASALNYLGYMLADRNVRLEEAQKLVGDALALEPQNGAFLDSMAWVYYRLNRLDEAENLLVRALEKIGRDPTVREHLGDVYLKQGKVREAIAQWQTALKESESASASDIDPADVSKIRTKLESAKVRLAQETTASHDKR